MPYQLPEGYFEELSPVLTVVQDGSTYRCPKDILPNFPERMLEKVAAPVPVAKSSRYIAKTRKVLKGNWWKYSVGRSHRRLLPADL